MQLRRKYVAKAWRFTKASYVPFLLEKIDWLIFLIDYIEFMDLREKKVSFHLSTFTPSEPKYVNFSQTVGNWTDFKTSPYLHLIIYEKLFLKLIDWWTSYCSTSSCVTHMCRLKPAKFRSIRIFSTISKFDLGAGVRVGVGVSCCDMGPPGYSFPSQGSPEFSW